MPKYCDRKYEQPEQCEQYEHSAVNQLKFYLQCFAIELLERLGILGNIAFTKPIRIRLMKRYKPRAIRSHPRDMQNIREKFSIK